MAQDYGANLEMANVSIGEVGSVDMDGLDGNCPYCPPPNVPVKLTVANTFVCTVRGNPIPLALATHQCCGQGNCSIKYQ